MRMLTLKVCALVIFGGVTGAYASLISEGAFTATGSGIGAVSTVLTMQSLPASTNTTESGCVSWDGTTNVFGAPCPGGIPGGDEKTGASQTLTRTIGSLDYTGAGQILVVFNANQPNATSSIDLTNLVLTVYSPTGSTLFSSGAFAGMNFSSTTPGIGTSDFAFDLSSSAADNEVAALNSAVFSPGNYANDRIGLAAEATGARGGFETFSLASQSVAPTGGGGDEGGDQAPEPSSLLLAGGGLILAGTIRRPRKQ